MVFFKSGDIVRIIDENGNNIGLGNLNMIRKRPNRILVKKLSKPFIHYDYLVINEKNKTISGICIIKII